MAPECPRCGYTSPDDRVHFCGMCGGHLEGEESGRIAKALSALERAPVDLEDCEALQLEIAMDGREAYHEADSDKARAQFLNARSRAVAGIVDARKVRTISLLKAPTEGGDDPVAWMRERMGDSSRPPDKLVNVTPGVPRLMEVEDEQEHEAVEVSDADLSE